MGTQKTLESSNLIRNKSLRLNSFCNNRFQFVVMNIYSYLKNHLGHSLIIALLMLLLPLFSQSQVKPMDADLNGLEYPFPVKYIRLDIQKQQYRMAYMDLEPAKSNGKAIVLLHGKNFSSAYWKKTAEALLEEGYRVIMPDQIGFGKSSKPQWFQYL